MYLIKHNRPLRLLLLSICLLLAGLTLDAQRSVTIKNKWQKAGAGTDYYLQATGDRVTAGPSAAESVATGWILQPVGDYYRLRSMAEPTNYLHIENGPLAVGAAAPGWLSAQWKLEPAGNGFRIANRWKPTLYLHIEEAEVTAGPIQPNWLSAQWTVGDRSPSPGTTDQEVSTPGSTPARDNSGNATSLDGYIASLDYDPRNVLSVTEDGSTESIPPGGKKERKSNPQSTAVIICTKNARKLDKKMDKISVLKPSAGVIYPGALVLANRQLSEGLPTPVTLKKAPLTLRIDLPGLQDNGTRRIDNPTNSNVQSAINGLLEEWNGNPRSEGYVNAANSIQRVEKAYSSEQVALELGFRLDWADNFVSAATKVNTSSESSVTVAFFQQVFYTVTMDSPERPSAIFDRSVSLAAAKQVFNSDNPPAYVRSVDYGRTVMVRMETSKSSTEVDVEAALKYAINPTTQVSGDLKAKYKSITDNSTFTVYTVGGNAQTPTVLAGGDISVLSEVIEKDAVYRRDNPGLPIAYTVAFLRDNSVASVNSASDFVETNCVEYPNGFVKLQHQGGYVGFFEMTWLEPDANGNLQPRSWNSGDKTAGYSETRDLPGDARQVKIVGKAYTGLVWDPVGECMNVTLNGPDNKTYTITGTTLNRSYNVSQ